MRPHRPVKAVETVRLKNAVDGQHTDFYDSSLGLESAKQPMGDSIAPEDGPREETPLKYGLISPQ